MPAGKSPQQRAGKRHRSLHEPRVQGQGAEWLSYTVKGWQDVRERWRKDAPGGGNTWRIVQEQSIKSKNKTSPIDTGEKMRKENDRNHC